MKLFSRNGSDNQYLAALDIGTEFTKVLIAEFIDDDSNDLRVIGVGRARQEFGNMTGGAISDITGVIKSCESALMKAEDQAGVRARNVVIGIAGEFVKGITSTIRYRRPRPDRELDSAEMSLIINKIQERAAVKAQQQIGIETGTPDVDVKLVNSAIVSIHIDGYKVSNPLGFTGKDVAIQIYTAFAPAMHISALGRTADSLDLELLAVAAEPFAVARAVLGNESDQNYTAILCDIGGGSTDIAVVNDGGVEGTRMFGVAGRSFTKTISHDLGISYEAAEKLKVNLSNDNIKQKVRDAIDSAVDKTTTVWLSGVQIALDEFDTLDHLPTKFLLCGGGASLEGLVDSLETANWYKELPFVRRPQVQHIGPDDVIGISDATGDVQGCDFITALGLLRVGYDTIKTTDNSDKGIKGRLDRILRI